MKETIHKNIFTPKSKQDNVLKEQRNIQNVSSFQEYLKIAKEQKLCSPEVIKHNQDIIGQIDNINNNVNESLKNQMDSWKYSTFEADKFLQNTYNWIGRYMMFLQKVQEFYDHHPEIAKLTRENDDLKKDQDYFELILNKYQRQADEQYDKLKNSLILRNQLEKIIKKKKKKASQLLIQRINMERVLDSKKSLIEVVVDTNLRRDRSNVTKRNEFKSNNSSSVLLRSLSSKKRSDNLSSIITSTEASRNMISINNSIQVGSILPSISPKVNQGKGYLKQKSSFLFDSQSKDRKYGNNNAQSIQKASGIGNLDQYLNSNLEQSSSKIEANDLSYLYKIGSIARKQRAITEMEVSPIVRSAKKQLQTIESLFKVPKPKGEYSLSSYKNLSYIKDKKKEQQKRLLQNQSLMNQSISTLGDSSVLIDDTSSIQKQIQNRGQYKSLLEYQDSLSIIKQISKTKDQYSIQQIENKNSIINDQSVIYLDQNEAQNAFTYQESDDKIDANQQELHRINREIKLLKEEIKQKNKKLQESSRKFYRIEYFFDECLKCSEKTMMKKIENLQLSGFELSENMENLLNILDKFDDVGGIKQIVKRQNKAMLSEQEEMEDQESISDLMDYKDFKGLSMKQLLFSVCRSNQMKFFLTKILKQKGEQVKNTQNEIKQLISQLQFTNTSNKLQKANTDSIQLRNDYSLLEIIQEKIPISHTSPTQRNKKILYKFSSKNNI